MNFLLELNVQPTKIKPKGGKHALVFIGFCGEWSCMLINAWFFKIFFGSLEHSIYYLMHLFLMHQLIGQELVKKTQNLTMRCHIAFTAMQVKQCCFIFVVVMVAQNIGASKKLASHTSG